MSKKKQRTKNEFFIVEGIKGIEELLSMELSLIELFTTEDRFAVAENKKNIVTAAELKKISQLTTPQTALAIFHIPPAKPLTQTGLTLALDGVRDPGNLGTLVRICDWFGIADLVCSTDCVDCYNPKVVQATMGSIARVNIVYTDLENYLISCERPIYGAFMEGEKVYETPLQKEGVLVLGNEANGISPLITKRITEKISIPRFGSLQATESLNVATAGAILLSEFKRRG